MALLRNSPSTERGLANGLVNSRSVGWIQRAFLPLLLGCTTCFAAQPVSETAGPDLRDQVSQHESAGDLSGARSLLEQRTRTGPDDPDAAQALAIFLERHADPGSRDAYVKWAAGEKDAGRRRLALRQVVLLDFMSGREADLTKDLAQYRAAGGSDLPGSIARQKAAQYSVAVIPGPLASFARMAALTPDLSPEELLPALARNVVTNGYEASGNEALEQTEYLRLLIRYIGQARELQALAGKDQKIVIPNCDSEQTGNLLKILGYRMRGSCGADIVLETVNATRAFLTVDSAFPLTRLEQDLRANHRFEVAYAPTPVPVLYNSEYWLTALGRNGQSDFVDAFLSDPSLCRLYLGLSHLDRTTADALRKQAAPAKLKVYAHVLDFYGSMFQIRNGAAVVPGSAKAWASLAGASPNNPGAFFIKLLATDDGWLASYYDALSRLEGPTAAYLTQPERMKRYYDALRGKVTSPGPARPVFRSSTELMLLTTALRVDGNGQAHVPGDLNVWRNLFIHHPHGKYDGKLTRSAASWRTNDDLMEALFALSRKTVENEPLKIFLTLNDIDRVRAKPISAELAGRLITAHRQYGDQYTLFAESPALSEASIGRYLDICAATLGIRDNLLKSDTAGTMQALVELWRILCLQNAIAPAMQNDAFAKIIAPFTRVRQESEVFDGARSGVDVLLTAANRAPVNGSRQEEIVELLVGKLRSAAGPRPASPAENFLRVFDSQLLIPLDSLFTAADRIGKGAIDAKTLKAINQQTERLDETQTLRGSLSSEEKSSFSLGYWSERHIAQEHKLNLDALAKNPEKKDARSALAPFVRDSLIGLLYSYYAPSGAQLLITNPLFVRSHDFIGPESAPVEWRNTEVAGSGWPASAGGRLMGSLIALPYALAEAEQNFLSPKRAQALIWSDLVPQMIVDVTVNRWRNIKPEQLRWVSLHMQRGHTLLAAAALDSGVEQQVLNSYGRFATPAKVEWLQDQLNAGHFALAAAEVPPAVLYAMAEDSELQSVSPDVPSAEIAAMAGKHDPDLTPDAIAHTFGTPKPTLTHSFQPGLLNLRTFPALMGYSSRILAETWESNNLYYAALADQAGVPADQLDAYVPEWNRSAIENIFATHLEDWPALLRSLHTLGNSVRDRGNQPRNSSSSEE